MTIIGIHHVQITVPKGAEDEARRFYCATLGLHEIDKPAALRSRGGFWLQAGRLQVHVGTEDGVVRAATKAHVAYQVTGLAAWKIRLEAAGVALLDNIPIPGYERFEIRDPFGNRIEFIEPLPNHS
jgi:catechol 2,3-dioxygenase-like lactoylglutathione lyase family enzyme